MTIADIIVKILVILGMIVLMAAPLLLEYATFALDRKRKISHRRFRVLLFAAIYILAVTVVLALVKGIFSWIATWPLIRWILKHIAISDRSDYCVRVFTVMLLNFLIGMGFWLLSKLPRIGIGRKKKDEKEEDAEGEPSEREKSLEQRIVLFFHTDGWLRLIKKLLKNLGLILSAAYAVFFVIYQIPVFFGADWVPYPLISMFFHAANDYPILLLLGIWEMYFFLAGVEKLEEENEEWLEEEQEAPVLQQSRLEEIDQAVKKEYGAFYGCDVDLLKSKMGEVKPTEHDPMTNMIADSIRSDQRDPREPHEVYLNCMDALLENEQSTLIKGSFFSEFSAYFVRYLSVIAARGDNVVLVCNTEAQIESVCDCLRTGLSRMSSLYFEGDNSITMDEPIWNIASVKNAQDGEGIGQVDQCSFLVTTLSYLCSEEFEVSQHEFIHLIDTVVFIDTLKTVNTYHRQLSILNTRLKHITETNALKAQNSENFNVRYMSRPVRYICFDDTRTPDLNEVLNNMLSANFRACDAMKYSRTPLVRCYNFEARKNEDGETVIKQPVGTIQRLDVLVNMALYCLDVGADSVTVFADGILPYARSFGICQEEQAQMRVNPDENTLRINRPHYSPKSYSVIIAMDSEDNLPAAIRRYVSMVSDEPTLIYVFSRPYMMRDYYMSHIDELWSVDLSTNIPVESNSARDVAQKILARISSGGITAESLIALCAGSKHFDELVKAGDVHGILREILAIYGKKEDRIGVYQYFQYSSLLAFDENGFYNPAIKIYLSENNLFYRIISGRHMVQMVNEEEGDKEYPLPIPCGRLTQHIIERQNLLYEGKLYTVQYVDATAGKIVVSQSRGGAQLVVYQYIQDREYRVEINPEQVDLVCPVKHVFMEPMTGDIRVTEGYISVLRAPMEVLTKGYYEINPYTLARNVMDKEYVAIDHPSNDRIAKQTYRKYGLLRRQAYSSEAVMHDTKLISGQDGALMMSIRLKGQFGPDINRTMALAAVMLNEQLRIMYPSLIDEVVVCPVLHGDFKDAEEAKSVLKTQSKLILDGENDLFSDQDFELLIIEDSATDLGVVIGMMNSGADVLETLFAPLARYLEWYNSAEQKSNYLYFGQDHEPSCFDFASLGQLADILADEDTSVDSVKEEEMIEYVVCDFCGKRCIRGTEATELEDGRIMCTGCKENLVSNSPNDLKEYLEHAKSFLENHYGIKLDNDYEFCFESTVKIINSLKQKLNHSNRGSDVPLRGYVEDKKVHVECDIPAASLSELLVRELTYTWQLNHLPDISEELAEGHIALVAVQYLRFMNLTRLVEIRTAYYESTENISGQGYRNLAHELLTHTQYCNNPFRYLIAMAGEKGKEIPVMPPQQVGESELGERYTPENPDRVLNGPAPYFYYNRLSAQNQKLYEQLLEAALAHKSQAQIEGFGALDSTEAAKLFSAVTYDHPELFWFRNISWSGDNVNLIFGASAAESDAIMRRIEEVIPKYLEGIDDSMSAYDVALRLNLKILASVEYDFDALAEEERAGKNRPVEQIDYIRSICGVFLNGKAVCEGYARGLQFLLQRCGIECAEAAGNIWENGKSKGGHAWNIVKIDGDYYYMDSTWDDNAVSIQTVRQFTPEFDYFCITTEELTRSRDLSMCPVEMPPCTATRANYYTHNHLLLESADMERLKSFAKAAAEQKSFRFTFKCTTKEFYEEIKEQCTNTPEFIFELLAHAAEVDPKINPRSFYKNFDDNIWTVTIMFQYNE